MTRKTHREKARAIAAVETSVAPVTINLRLLAAFFLSGLSGLMYQTVWVRMLTRLLGSTTPATATVLAVFMAGLALGGLLGGRLSERLRRPLTGYALLEAAIAATACLASFLLIDTLGRGYLGIYDWLRGRPGLILTARVSLAASCLLIPSALMGATLPLLVKWAAAREELQTGLGRLYALNTAGAVAGVLLAGFVLLGEIGERNTVFLAVVFNLAAAALAWSLDLSFGPVEARVTARPAGTQAFKTDPTPYPGRVRAWAKAALFWSGFSALAYEILWTRYLLLPLWTSIYSYSFMLGLMLAGIALGSFISTRFDFPRRRPLANFALSEVLIGVSSAAGLTAFLVLGRLTEGFRGSLSLNLLTAVLMVFPAALVFGWQFPLAVRCGAADFSAGGRETGSAYFINSMGTILGSLAAGFLLIPWLGTAKAMAWLAATNLALGFVLLALSPAVERGWLAWASSLLALAAVTLLVLSGDPYREVLKKRLEAEFGRDAEIYAYDEGVAATTVPVGSPRKPRGKGLMVNGINMTVLVSETKFMAHLPLALIPGRPEKMLIICFGMGTTLRSAVKYLDPPGRIDVVDIVPVVFDYFRFYHRDAADVLARPGVRAHADDGRNFLLLTREKYDVINIDPAPPLYSAGTVNLYTREFLAMCRSRLTERGLVCLWLPPAPASELYMIMRTFANEFPGACLWGGLNVPGLFLVGGRREPAFREQDLDGLAEKLASIRDLSEWDPSWGRPKVIKDLYLAGPEELRTLTAPYRQVTDDRPYTEFPLWRGALSVSSPDSRTLNVEAVRRDLKSPPAKFNQ
ncbi:MAG: fused MFS/spermidine synthase [Thermodesulfobacteriota bacterium]